MRRVVLLIALACLAGAGVVRAAPQSAPATIGKLTLSSVVDWQGGLRDGLLISNNEGGELRLGEGRRQGVFTSSLTKVGFPFNAVGMVWRADVPSGARLTLEVRGGPADDQLGPWRAFAAGDARSQSDDGALAIEAVRLFPAGSTFIQLRATFSSTVANASPVLKEITISYLDTTPGPALSAGLPRVLAPFGPATLTPPPLIMLRTAWSGEPPPTTPVARQAPRGIILHQIGPDDLDDPLPFLRGLATYSTQVLGWDDMPFHFVIDSAGTIYEGRRGGPTAAVTRLAGGDTAIHVALLGNTTPSSSTLTALTSLLAWLGQAYAIEPSGQHTVTPPGGSPTARPNIAAHAEAVVEAVDPSPELLALLDQIRRNADQSTVRARWYFAEGNVHDYAERLAVLNPGPNAANVRFMLLRQPGPVVREATVPAGGRADLIVNTVFSDTTDVPAIVESNTAVIAERFMDFGSDITASPGITRPARVWYFAEGSTDGDRKTFLLLFNPQRDEVSATITYMQGDGATAEQQVRIPALRRTVVSVADTLPGVGFGARVIASQPIVAERTMIFGPGSTLTSGGVHTAPGVQTLGRRWYFAEGTTQAPMRMWVLVLNPNAQPANVAVTFLTADGTTLTRRYAIPPTTRLPINVNEVVPDLGVATTIEADRPVAAERAMYWKDGGAGMVTAGATAPAFTWRFADGRTSGEFQEYLLLSNPNPRQARVTVEFVLSDGKKATQAIVMPGNSRYTMAVHQLYPGQPAIAATARSTQPIVIERSLYAGGPETEANRGGATSLGVPEEQ